MLRYPLPSAWCTDVDVALYLKDETTHITGSLKRRLARSLFLYAVCNGWIGEGSTVIEASSGSTAVSEAYFAALLGLPFIAVMPQSNRYTDTYFSDEWVSAQGLDPTGPARALVEFERSSRWAQ